MLAVRIAVRCRRSDKDVEVLYVGEPDGVESFRSLAEYILAIA
jgi:hypothetical protein